MTFAFIEPHATTWPVRHMCRVLGVSPSGYHGWRSRSESARSASNRQRLDDVQRIHTGHHRRSGIIDIAQPVMNRLARETEELVRLAILDGNRLTLVAKAVGSKVGLLYDPDMGIDLKLSCSAAGHAWLATLSDQQATEVVVRQGVGDPESYGPNAPVTVEALLEMLKGHRKRGFSLIQNMYAPGLNSMAAVIRRKGEPAAGALIVAGPSSRFAEERMLHVGPSLMKMANELALIGSASPLLKPDDRGTWGNMA